MIQELNQIRTTGMFQEMKISKEWILSCIPSFKTITYNEKNISQQ